MDGGAWWVTVHESQRVGHDWATFSLSLSFRINRFDLIVQGICESSPAPQFESISSSVLSLFLIVQFSHLYMSTGKTISLTICMCVGKVMSLLFSMLFRLVIDFLARSKSLLISWLQSPSAVILESKKMESVMVSIVSPSICHEVGPDWKMQSLDSRKSFLCCALSYLGPVSYIFSSWVSSGCMAGGSWSEWLLSGNLCVLILVSLLSNWTRSTVLSLASQVHPSVYCFYLLG